MAVSFHELPCGAFIQDQIGGETGGERANIVGVLDREDLYLAVSEVTRRSRARAV